MASTIPDVILDNLSYQNVNALSGIPVGTRILLQFKGSGSIRLQIKPTQPITNSMDGVQVPTLDIYVVDAGESIVWARGTGRLCVQEG